MVAEILQKIKNILTILENTDNNKYGTHVPKNKLKRNFSK
jgi:hypothetical protein